MFVTLSDLAQAQQSGPWSDEASKASALVVAKDWATLVIMATQLADRALKAQAIPVSTLAGQLKTVAGTFAAGNGKDEDLAAAIQGLVDVARREDDSTPPDRIRNEEIIDRRFDEYERSYGDWQKAHGGLMALWDKIRGGPDLSPFQNTLKDIRSKIDLTALTPEGRQRLLDRHTRLVAGLQPGDWKILVATGVGALALNTLISKATTAAAARAALVAEQASGRVLGRKKPPEKPKKRKKAKKKTA